MIAIALPDGEGSNLYANPSLPAKGVLSVRIRPDQMTDILQPVSASNAVKYVENGQLIIRHNDNTYNVFGAKIN